MNKRGFSSIFLLIILVLILALSIGVYKIKQNVSTSSPDSNSNSSQNQKIEAFNDTFFKISLKYPSEYKGQFWNRDKASEEYTIKQYKSEWYKNNGKLWYGSIDLIDISTKEVTHVFNFDIQSLNGKTLEEFSAIYDKPDEKRKVSINGVDALYIANPQTPPYAGLGPASEVYVYLFPKSENDIIVFSLSLYKDDPSEKNIKLKKDFDFIAQSLELK